MGAKVVRYFEDLAKPPEEGPFVVGLSVMTNSYPRIEQMRGPEGIGCPVLPHPSIRDFMEKHGIPTGRNHTHESASKLNELYKAGAFEWDGCLLVPKEEADVVS